MTAPGEERRTRHGRFATTRWSVVLAAGGRSTKKSRESLAHLCETYWHPVYAYVRRKGLAVEEAQDLTQQFFATFLEKGYAGAATPERGRFRSFLLASVQHFLYNEWDRQRAKKRGGGAPLLPLEFERAEGVLQLEPATDVTPERLFERRWAQQVVHRVLDRLRAEQEQAGKADTFSALRPLLVDEGDYADAAAALGATAGAVRVAVHRLRRRFRTLLLEEIADTVGSATEIDGEMRFLVNALRAPADRRTPGHA